MEIKFQLLVPGAKAPVYQTEGSAGCDLSACLPLADVVIPSGEYRKIPTGFAMAGDPVRDSCHLHGFFRR